MDKLREASEPTSHFTLKLELNGKQLAKKSFMADKYQPETLNGTGFQFMLVDLTRLLQEQLRKKDAEVRKAKGAQKK